MFVFWFFFGAIVQAKAITYCVGGFDKKRPHAEAYHACNSASVRRSHPRWHRHGLIIRDKRTKECYICWDEVDDTCDTIFMVQNAKRYEHVWDANTCRSSDKNKVKFHVKDGVDILKNKPEKVEPPPPKPETLDPKINIRQGPYTQGETIRVGGSLVTPAGEIGKNNGVPVTPDSATVSIKMNGETISTVPAVILQDGSFEADLTLPTQEPSIWDQLVGTAPEVEIVLDVVSSGLPQQYKLGSNSTTETIVLSECLKGLELITPLDEAKTAALIPTKLQARLGKDNKEKQAQISFQVLFPDASLLQAQAEALKTFPAAQGTASWNPPALLSPRDISYAKISAFGELDGAKICPTNPVTVEVSGESILPETTILKQASSSLPDVPPQFQGQSSCLVGEICDVQIEMKTPENTSATFLNDPATQVAVIDNTGKEVYSSNLGSSKLIQYAYTPTQAGTETPVIRFTDKDGGEHFFDSTTISVRDSVKLGLPSVIDFGHVTAKNWLDKCHIVDVKDSGLQQKDGLRISAKGFDKECNMELYYVGDPRTTVVLDALKVPIKESGEGYLDILLSGRDDFGICVQPGDCGADNSPQNAEISLIPLEASLQRYSVSSQVKWTSDKSPFYAWSCWGEFLAYMFGFLGMMGLVMGYTRPPRFENHMMVKMSPKKNMDKNVRKYILADEPCRTFKIFQGDQIMFSSSGEPCLSEGMLVCKATADGGISVNGAVLELYQERDAKWVAVEEQEYFPMGSKLYRLKGHKQYIKFLL